MKTEIINSCMPGFLALLGFGFGACALFAPNVPNDIRGIALGTSGYFIGAGSGLAQPERKG